VKRRGSKIGKKAKVTQSKERNYEPRTIIIGYVFRMGLRESGHSGHKREPHYQLGMKKEEVLIIVVIIVVGYSFSGRR
jgi:hypothetical protein